jgi:DNA-binding SARP family transcriptional activator
MGVLRVFLFGKFQVKYDEQLLTGLEARKVQELFGYLLFYRDRPHARENLAHLLWGDGSTSTPQTKKYLRQALWQLQTALSSPSPAAGQGLMLLEPEWVQFNPQADLWLDVASFEEAFAVMRQTAGQPLDAEKAQILQTAVQLYQGDLLEGWYQDWCLYERERLQNIYLAMLDKLMHHCEQHQAYEAGLEYGSRILRCDRAHERTHRRMMYLYYLAGDRTAALRQYRYCQAALQDELGVEPDKSTQSLYAQLRVDAVETDVTEFVGQKFRVGLPEVLNRLKHLQTALADFQRQVKQDIQTVESALKDEGEGQSLLPDWQADTPTDAQ